MIISIFFTYLNVSQSPKDLSALQCTTIGCLGKHTSKHTLVLNDDRAIDQMILSGRSIAHFIIEKKWKFKVILPCIIPHPYCGGRGEGDTQWGTERERKREVERD